MNGRRRKTAERGATGTPLYSWDDDLGRELRESPVPAHAPDHFEQVRARMRRLTGPDGRPPAPPGRARPRPVPPAPRRHRRGIRLAAVAAVAAATVAAVAITWSGVPGIRQSTPQPATADTVLARVQHALANLHSISGDVVEYGSARGRPFSRRVGSFTFTSRGDYRIVQRSEDVAYTYDAVKRVARRYVFRDGKALYSEVARDLPDPGPFFSPWMGASQVLDRSVAAYARAVIAELDPDVPVTPVTWEGRKAWSITVPEPLAGGGDDGTARIVVDAESGYPLAVEHWTSDGDVSGTRIENVHVGGEVPRSRFQLAVDVQDKLLPMSQRFRRVTLPQAAALGRRAATPFTPYQGDLDPARLPSQRRHRRGQRRLLGCVPSRFATEKSARSPSSSPTGAGSTASASSAAGAPTTRPARMTPSTRTPWRSANLRGSGSRPAACEARPRAWSWACRTGRTSTSAPVPTTASR